MRGGERPASVLLLVHHFAVDLFALEILRQDFILACNQFVKGARIQLPARSSRIATLSLALALLYHAVTRFVFLSG